MERDLGAVQSYTLITTGANGALAPIHDRMPVIPPESPYDLGLDAAVKDPKRLRPLLMPLPTEVMEACPASTLVYSPANDIGAVHHHAGVRCAGLR